MRFLSTLSTLNYTIVNSFLPQVWVWALLARLEVAIVAGAYPDSDMTNIYCTLQNIWFSFVICKRAPREYVRKYMRFRVK
jgi:hypothetical protein